MPSIDEIIGDHQVWIST